MIEWDRLPSCAGEYQERAKLPILVSIEAQNWSNKEQRRLPIDSTTKWGVWVGGTRALKLDCETLEAARVFGLFEARRRIVGDIHKLTATLAEIDLAIGPS